MKRMACLLAMLLAGLTTGAVAVTDTAAEGAPKIVFEHTQHDFGTQPQSTKAQHTFVFRNEGTETLRIEKVKAG